MEKFLETSQNQSAASSEKSVAKKRKCSVSTSDDDGQPAEKYLELSEIFTLDRFCDEVLIEIFKNLDTNTILSLEDTCTRFSGLVADYRLWDEIDAMGQNRSTEELKYILNRAHKNTTVVKINGVAEDSLKNKKQKECLLRYVIPKCQHLVDLELENVYVNFTKITIQDFPKNLRRLVFRHISVHWPDDAHTIFKKIDRSLIWLEELRVESCTWFHPYDIMLFSKCPSLKKLSLRGCSNLSDFVPYGSMASRFGFKSLEFLDVRDTPITDSDLQCFNAILTLKELLLECPTYLRIVAPDEESASKPEPSTSSSPSTSTSQNNENTQPSASASASTSKSTSTSTSSTSTATSTTNATNPANPANPANAANPANRANQMNADGDVFFELIPEGVGRCGTIHIPRGLSNVVMTINLTQHTRPVDRANANDPAQPANRRIPYREGSPDHFNRILRNPQFWDMIEGQPSIDPLGPCSTMKPSLSPITNRGISCFGRPANPIDQKIIWIRIGNRPTDNTFQRLCLRHYKRITDDSLKHLVQCSPNLVYLDVSGTGVTRKGISDFKACKPNCVVICEHIKN